MQFLYSLEKYRDQRTRHRCPACNAAGRFVRYVNNETGEYLADDVGRCNRESKCSYHRTPRQHFADNPQLKPARDKQSKAKRATGFVAVKPLPKIFDTVPPTVFEASIGNYERNAFVEWLLSQFDEITVESVMRHYFIGTWTDGRTVFWQLDEQGRVRTGKFMRYDAATGKRTKNSTNWTHAALIKQDELPPEWTGEQCFFGQHLLADAPEEQPIAVVESAKTAIIASIFLPDFVWLSTEGKTNEIVRKLLTLWQRVVVLFPDADAYGEWTRYADEAAQQGVDVTVSDLLERAASDEEKREGCDLADYLISAARQELTKRNAAIQEVLNNAELLAELEDVICERAAIMEIDGETEPDEAFRQAAFSVICVNRLQAP